MKKVCTLVAVGLMAGIASANTVIAPVNVTLENAGTSYLQNPGNGTAASGELWYTGAGLLDPSIVETGDPVPTVWPEHISGYNNTRLSRVRDTDQGPAGTGKATLTFDLGGTFEVGGMALWNNTEDGGNSVRGFENTLLRFSTDGGSTYLPATELLTWTERNDAGEVAGNQGVTEPIGGWITSPVEVQYLASSVPGVTHIQMDVDSFDESNVIVQIAELRFIAGEGSVIPDPANLSVSYNNDEVTINVTDMTPTATSKLQGNDDLTNTNTWDDLVGYTSTGTSSTNWVVPTTETNQFFRVISE